MARNSSLTTVNSTSYNSGNAGNTIFHHSNNYNVSASGSKKTPEEIANEIDQKSNDLFFTIGELIREIYDSITKSNATETNIVNDIEEVKETIQEQAEKNLFKDNIKLLARKISTKEEKLKFQKVFNQIADDKGIDKLIIEQLFQFNRIEIISTKEFNQRENGENITPITLSQDAQNAGYDIVFVLDFDKKGECVNYSNFKKSIIENFNYGNVVDLEKKATKEDIIECLQSLNKITNNCGKYFLNKESLTQEEITQLHTIAATTQHIKPEITLSSISRDKKRIDVKTDENSAIKVKTNHLYGNSFSAEFLGLQKGINGHFYSLSEQDEKIFRLFMATSQVLRNEAKSTTPKKEIFISIASLPNETIDLTCPNQAHLFHNSPKTTLFEVEASNLKPNNHREL